MSEVYGRAYVVNLTFTALRAFPIISWSGSFAASLIHSALGPQLKPFSVSPLYVDGRMLLTGRVEEGRASYSIVNQGSKVSFRVTFQDRQSLDALFTQFQRLEDKGLRLESLNVEELRLPRDPQGITGDRVIVTVEYAPTIFTFRSWRVLYPSPQRLIYSAASTASKLTGVDLRKAASRLAKRIELVDTPKIEVEDYTIGKKDEKERIVKTFKGTATYGVYGAKNAEILIALIKLAEKTNIGKSRGIGFGQVKLKPYHTIE